MYKQKENRETYDRLRQYKKDLRDIVRVQREISQEYLKDVLNYHRLKLEDRLDKIKYEL